jgi:trehalose-6-phosphatase
MVHTDPTTTSDMLLIYQGCSFIRHACRVILLDYDRTMVPEMHDTTKMVLRLLDQLCPPPPPRLNVVFVVSGRRKDQMTPWFDTCDKVGGICA